MADYQAQIRLGVEGLGQLQQLERRLENAVDLLGRLEAANANVGQAAQSSQRNVGAAGRRRAVAGRELRSATRTVENVAMRRDPNTGLFLPGGANATARRLANANLRLAQRDAREADRRLREEEQNRRLIFAAQRRYARALDRAGNLIGGVQGGIGETQARVDAAMRGISRESRVNYLTNLFQGRQREFSRGGGGAGLSAELQQQARNTRAAFDLASAGGRENLQLMQRLATEMAGIVRQQNEMNRTGAGRSSAFESARRGQERLDVLAQRPGADRQRIERMRARAASVIEASNRGDIAGARDLARRMNASIMRYTRELDAAANQLKQQQMAGFRNLNIRQNWATVLQDIGAEQQIRARALPDRNLLAQRVAMSGQDAPARLDEQKRQADKAAAEAAKQAAGSLGRFGAALEREEKRRARLGIGAVERVGGPVRRVAAIPLGGGAESGIVPRALPSDRILAQRVAQSQQLQPTRLDDLRDAARKAEAEAEKRAAGSTRRYADAVEREAKRLERLGIGQAPVRGPGGAIPMGGTNGMPFNQLPFPAGPGNARGIAQFREIQRQRQASGADAGFFQGNARKAISEGLIGGAFPLLFGQGVGASIGGAAGGVSGGLIGGSFGFGLSLIGTALGAAVDTVTNNLKELAEALKSPNDAITALETSGFRVSDSLKFQVEQLQSVGRAYDAQTLVLQEVERRLGAGSVQGLNALNAEQKRLDESWARLSGTLQSQLIPALVGFTNGVNEVIDAVSGLGELPVVKQLLQARGALASTPLGRVIVPFALAEGQFQAAQRRGRTVAASAPTRPQLTPQEAFASETTRIQESRRIADQIKSAYREAFQLQRRAYDLQREGADINREIADYTYRKQREIFDLRQQVAEKEIENNRAAAQNQIERGDLGAREAFAAATGFEQQLLTNAREVMRTRKEGEADIEQSRRRLELTMAKLNRDVEDYKRTNAREIEDIERRKLSYTRSVEDYKMNVADYVLQRARETADLMRQAMTLPEVGGAVSGLAPYAPVSPLERIPYMTEIDRAARNANVDPRLLAGLVRQESNFNPRAVSSSGAVGLAQLMPGTARELGVDPRNMQQNLEGGARYLRQMIDMFGSVEAGLRAYNQGPGAQRATPAGNSRESREYPGLVLGHARRYGFNPQAAVPPAGGIPAPGSSAIEQATAATARFTGIANQCANAVKIFMQSVGVNASVMDASAKSAERMGAVMTDWSQLRPGDIVARGAVGDPEHVGVYTGGQNVFHQSRSRGLRTGNFPDLGYFQQQGYFVRPTGGSTAAAQMSNIPQPRFNATPIGATPSAAPINAERMAVLSRMVGGEQEAQRLLEEQIQLRQKGVELGQIEQILQANQLPQLEQQYETLKLQVEARRQDLALSDEAASIADIQAETTARIAQLEKDRTNALSKVQQQYEGNVDLVKQVNTQADLAIDIAKKEEEQRRRNLDLNNKLQNQERVRTEILQLQENLALAKAEAAALERGELEASNVELMMASSLYRQADEAQRSKLRSLTAETEELRKQNEFNKQINKLRQDTRFVGAGLRAGLVGAGARAFEQGLTEFNGDTDRAAQLAKEALLLEDQQLIWDNLEKNIVDVSNAISGALTNGLLDVISGAKTLQDVGRETLNSIARSFADSAQQQLTTIMQRGLAAKLGGPEGSLTKMLGGTSAAAGPQALGSASLAASNSVMAFGIALQTVTAQMGISGALSGFGPMAASGIGSAVTSGIGSAFSSTAPNILGSLVPGSPLLSFPFGGFLANGGTATRGKGYVVGENEPEFFFPGVSGRVVPRSDMEKAAALQQGDSGNDPIDIRYTVTEQRGERYVTEEQFRKGMESTSKRTQAMTYAGMRNNQEIREYAGI